MIVRTPSEFLDAFAALKPLENPQATARGAFLLAPADFSLAQETATDNKYMAMDQVVDPLKALAQHSNLASALRQDVPIIVFPGDPTTPDAVFPNNVFGTAPGTFIVGKMRHPVRQVEATRQDIRSFFTDIMGYNQYDMSGRDDLVAELTGSLIIDHIRKIGYVGLTERCDLEGAKAMHEAFGLRLTFAFDLAEGEYHTNVVFTMLAGRGAILSADGYKDPEVPKAIAKAYDNKIVWLTPQQKAAFAGNGITLTEDRVWLSTAAVNSLTKEQMDQFAKYGFKVGHVDLSEIEKAGGSLRCCVAEIF